MKPTVAIVYQAGAYGTYLEWCLTNLTTGACLDLPFTANGNSHLFEGNALLGMPGWRTYLDSGTDHDFVRLHPKKTANENIEKNLVEIAKNCKHVIYLHGDQSTMVLGLNNWFFKIRDHYDWFADLLPAEDQQSLFKHWPVANDTVLDDIAPWIKREFLSYYMVPAWAAQFGFYEKFEMILPNTKKITVSNLLFDFENTLNQIKKFCDLEFQKPVSDLLAVHQKNLSLQRHLDQDQVCHAIIDATVNNLSHSWLPLSLPSESYIQWQLRNLGYEIRCHGLDIFPTNSLQLHELLYPI